ncbi:MAG: glycine cleavage system protein GcvH [Verrucomicrobia bacterium]|nr:glycine cleavage system protein GcvH [Verrucomicrobiota bacterium]
MNTPSDLRYTKNHEWARVEGNVATCGISDYAQEQLGDIVFVELPEEGSAVVQDGRLGVVESVKAASDIYAPLSGRVVGRNTGLEAKPETINKDPYGKGWIARIEIARPEESDSLMDAAAYAKYVEEEAAKQG